jgi:hypothetical protein
MLSGVALVPAKLCSGGRSRPPPTIPILAFVMELLMALRRSDDCRYTRFRVRCRFCTYTCRRGFLDMIYVFPLDLKLLLDVVMCLGITSCSLRRCCAICIIFIKLCFLSHGGGHWFLLLINFAWCPKLGTFEFRKTNQCEPMELVLLLQLYTIIMFTHTQESSVKGRLIDQHEPISLTWFGYIRSLFFGCYYYWWYRPLVVRILSPEVDDNTFVVDHQF